MSEIKRDVLDGQTFKKLLNGGAANLSLNSKTVDDLNVFPIPDGDTGENMSRTIRGGVSGLEGYGGNSLYEAASILADGMLLSARGNSGVILSRLFYGIAVGLEGKNEATVDEIGFAMKKGVESAYSAVSNPTEGTILTVAREATDYAVSRTNEKSTLETFAKDFYNELSASLKRTPELLAVLKEAGVIDSGGAGLFYIADGIMKTINGNQPSADTVNASAGKEQSVDFSLFDENSALTYGYCTEFLLRLQNAKTDIEGFSAQDAVDYLNSVGQSVVAFKNGSILKVHVHTFTPSKVLEHFQKYGEFLTVKIENMNLQHSGHEAALSMKAEKQEKRKKYAVVTVASGEGIKKTFEELGADVVISGGQCKNPSAEDFMAAFDKANADNIFVLPNNGNIILAAKQAAELYKKAKIYVAGSENIGEGYAALTMLSYDSDDADTILTELNSSMYGVVTGMITKSVKNTSLGGIDIEKDDYIGFSGKTMLSSSKEKIETAKKCLENLEANEHEILIAIYGNDVTEQQKTDFRRMILASFPSTELFEIDGGQDVYDFILILE